MSVERCPVCGGFPSRYLINNANLGFLKDCANKGQMDEAISVARIVWSRFPELRLNADSKMIIEGVSANMLKALQVQINETLEPAKIFAEKLPELVYKLPIEVDKNIGEKIEEIRTLLAKEFKETLSNMGFPEPEQLKLLSQLIPAVLPLLQDLLTLQKVPSEKGKFGELELLKELRDFFPEDDYRHIGGPGDTDIIATPIYGGFQLSQRVLIESKKNNSGWNRDFIDEVRRHMQAYSNRFAILAVEVMPKGARGFLIEHFNEGAILVTSRKDVCIAYGALRAVFIATYPFEVNVGELRKLFEEKRIEEAIKDALNYQEYLKRIKTKSATIMLNAKSIVEISDDLNTHLRICLTELQKRIRNAVEEIEEARPNANSNQPNILKRS
jgi:hypothetical protein